MEELNVQPLAVLFHGFMSDREVINQGQIWSLTFQSGSICFSQADVFVETANGKLFRSSTGHTGNSKKDLKRTSKQTWVTERFFTFNVDKQVMYLNFQYI